MTQEEVTTSVIDILIKFKPTAQEKWIMCKFLNLKELLSLKSHVYCTPRKHIWSVKSHSSNRQLWEYQIMPSLHALCIYTLHQELHRPMSPCRSLVSRSTSIFIFYSRLVKAREMWSTWLRKKSLVQLCTVSYPGINGGLKNTNLLIWKQHVTLSSFTSLIISFREMVLMDME